MSDRADDSTDDPNDDSLRPDTLNEVGVLKRREIEARIIAPLLDRLAGEYGTGVFDVAREVIVGVAREQGASLAELIGDDSLPAFGERTRRVVGGGGPRDGSGRAE